MLLPATAAGEETEETIQITESTVYVSSLADVVPNTLTADVPPTALCVVAPELCPPEADPVRDPLRETIGDGSDEQVSTPVQPLPPDTAASSFVGGNTQYQTAIRFDVPSAPAGEEYVQFTLTLAQDQPSFSLDSPAFRRIVLGLFETIGDQDPALMGEALQEALSSEDEDAVAVREEDLSEKIGIEACPLTQPFEPQGAPEATPSEEMPRDEHGEPAVDCVLGTAGTYDHAAGTWTFDLTFAASQWDDGTLANHGILLRPIGAPNLAFGDPDTSTNAQVVLALTDATMATSTAAPPPPLDDGPVTTDTTQQEQTSAPTESSSPPPPPPPAPSSSSPPPAASSGDASFDTTDLSAPDPVDVPVDDGVPEPQVANSEVVAQPSTTPAAAEPEFITPWWWWLFFPALIGGASVVTAVLLPAGAAGRDAGAMTRLIALRTT